MPEHDPLDSLGRAWSQMDLPPPVRELEEEDRATQEAVRWMAQAWQQLEIPPASLPRRRGILRPRSFALSAAAVLLVAAFGVLLPHLLVQDSAASPVSETTASGPAAPAMPAVSAPPTTEPQLLATTDDRVELRAGNVRLTMLRNTPASTETTRKPQNR